MFSRGGRKAALVCLCPGPGANLLAHQPPGAGHPQLSQPQPGRRPLTFGILPTQLPLLDEAPEHLGLHEHLQEAAEALGGDGLAEGLALQGPFLALAHRQEQGVMAHDLHEEADEGFRHHLVQGAGLRA